MEIRGLTTEEIRQAVERASARYGGNIVLKERHWQEKLPEPIDRSGEGFRWISAWPFDWCSIDG